jgi:hypothetical protein
MTTTFVEFDSDGIVVRNYLATIRFRWPGVVGFSDSEFYGGAAGYFWRLFINVDGRRGRGKGVACVATASPITKASRPVESASQARPWLDAGDRREIREVVRPFALAHGLAPLPEWPLDAGTIS